MISQFFPSPYLKTSHLRSRWHFLGLSDFWLKFCNLIFPILSCKVYTLIYYPMTAWNKQCFPNAIAEQSLNMPYHIKNSRAPCWFLPKEALLNWSILEWNILVNRKWHLVRRQGNDHTVTSFANQILLISRSTRFGITTQSIKLYKRIYLVLNWFTWSQPLEYQILAKQQVSKIEDATSCHNGHLVVDRSAFSWLCI